MVAQVGIRQTTVAVVVVAQVLGIMAAEGRKLEMLEAEAEAGQSLRGCFLLILLLILGQEALG